MLEIPQFTTKTVKLLMEHSMDEEHLLDWIAFVLTDWGWVTHICISKLNIIGSDNGSAPGRRQAIIWTNAGILLNGPMGTKLNRNLYIFIQEKAVENIVWKMAAIYSRPQCVNNKKVLLDILAILLRYGTGFAAGRHLNQD